MQDFRFAAPRDDLIFGGSGTLGELLFNGAGADLVLQLVVPVPPHKQAPGPISSNAPPQSQSDDDTAPTTTTGDLKETVHGNKPKERKDKSNERKDKSEKHKDKSEKRKGQSKKRKATEDLLDASQRRRKDLKLSSRTTVTLASLPLEIHHKIFSYVKDIKDIISLGFTSSQLWAAGKEHMHNFYASLYGQLAGKNIVCVGEHVKRGDYPPGLFSARERRELNQRLAFISHEDDYMKEEFGSLTMADEFTPFTLWYFTSAYEGAYFGVPEVSVVEESEEVVAQFSDLGPTEEAAFDILSSEMRVQDELYLPEYQPWILRNLTKKEFVRADAIALRPEFIHGPKIDFLGFGEVVISRICWSSTSSIGLGWEEEKTNLTRGVWAGHRFDITTRSRHDGEAGAEEWTDVSEEVAQEIETIWEGRYGEGWRDKVIDGEGSDFESCVRQAETFDRLVYESIWG